MSFRNTFITDFIYQGGDDSVESNEKLREIFKKYARHLSREIDERGLGYFSGILSSLDGSIDQAGIIDMVYELEKATKIPFRLTILMESGPDITYNINPTQ